MVEQYSTPSGQWLGLGAHTTKVGTLFEKKKKEHQIPRHLGYKIQLNTLSLIKHVEQFIFRSVIYLSHTAVSKQPVVFADILCKP